MGNTPDERWIHCFAIKLMKTHTQKLNEWDFSECLFTFLGRSNPKFGFQTKFQFEQSLTIST